MVFHLNSINDTVPVKRTVWDITQVPADQLLAILVEISALRGTGSLTINYSHGTPSGFIEWKQKSNPT